MIVGVGRPRFKMCSDLGQQVAPFPGADLSQVVVVLQRLDRQVAALEDVFRPFLRHAKTDKRTGHFNFCCDQFRRSCNMAGNIMATVFIGRLGGALDIDLIALFQSAKVGAFERRVHRVEGHDRAPA